MLSACCVAGGVSRGVSLGGGSLPTRRPPPLQQAEMARPHPSPAHRPSKSPFTLSTAEIARPFRALHSTTSHALAWKAASTPGPNKTAESLAYTPAGGWGRGGWRRGGLGIYVYKGVGKGGWGRGVERIHLQGGGKGGLGRGRMKRPQRCWQSKGEHLPAQRRRALRRGAGSRVEKHGWQVAECGIPTHPQPKTPDSLPTIHTAKPPHTLSQPPHTLPTHTTAKSPPPLPPTQTHSRGLRTHRFR